MYLLERTRRSEEIVTRGFPRALLIARVENKTDEGEKTTRDEHGRQEKKAPKRRSLENKHSEFVPIDRSEQTASCEQEPRVSSRPQRRFTETVSLST